MRSNHHITRDPTRIARSERQNENSEQIEPVLNPSHCAAEREDEGAAKVETHQQRIHNNLFIDDHLSYRDNQA
jgi:hypothetical protein